MGPEGWLAIPCPPFSTFLFLKTMIPGYAYGVQSHPRHIPLDTEDPSPPKKRCIMGLSTSLGPNSALNSIPLVAASHCIRAVVTMTTPALLKYATLPNSINLYHNRSVVDTF
ncbi:hypothetical protein TNCV_2691311, partial [Trichonephila clavipes]